MGETATNTVIQYCQPLQPKTLHYCITLRFYESLTKLTDGDLSLGSLLTQGLPASQPLPTTSINIADHPFIKYDLHISRYPFHHALQQ